MNKEAHEIAKNFVDTSKLMGDIDHSDCWIVYMAVLHGYSEGIKSITNINNSDNIFIMKDVSLSQKL
jgi:hypothetical protein